MNGIRLQLETFVHILLDQDIFQEKHKKALDFGMIRNQFTEAIQIEKMSRVLVTGVNDQKGRVWIFSLLTNLPSTQSLKSAFSP